MSLLNSNMEEIVVRSDENYLLLPSMSGFDQEILNHEHNLQFIKGRHCRRNVKCIFAPTGNRSSSVVLKQYY